MPKVSVIILNWNGKRFLKQCLGSVKKVTYKPLEVILVDNNSTDGSSEYVKRYFPWVKLVKNKENSGYAKGNNIGYKASTGEYLLFLNNDTKVTPNFLHAMIKDFQIDPTLGCIQPQMRGLDNPTLIDEAGAYMTLNGFLYHYGYRKDYRLSQYRDKRLIFSVKGACMLIPKLVFKKVGLFDEDFFIFFEETDLCYRLWLKGYRVMYEPRSSIYHLAGGDTIDKYNYARRIYLTIKNMNLCYIKNFGIRNFIFVFPFFVLTQIVLLLHFLTKFKIYLVKAILRAHLWNGLHLRDTIIKRISIQHSRKLSDKDINEYIYYNPGLKYYYYLLFDDVKNYKDKKISKHV